eukprot:3349142-Alexandrium_andersonii.AAC.1
MRHFVGSLAWLLICPRLPRGAGRGAGFAVASVAQPMKPGLVALSPAACMTWFMQFLTTAPVPTASTAHLLTLRLCGPATHRPTPGR